MCHKLFLERHDQAPIEVAAPQDLKDALGDLVTLDTSVQPGHVYMVLR
jgi:hypothetical protein